MIVVCLCAGVSSSHSVQKSGGPPGSPGCSHRCSKLVQEEGPRVPRALGPHEGHLQPLSEERRCQAGCTAPGGDQKVRYANVAILPCEMYYRTCLQLLDIVLCERSICEICGDIPSIDHQPSIHTFQFCQNSFSSLRF